MTCKKGTHEKCMCLKRKGGGCEGCEKNAVNIVQKSGKNLNEIIETVKESGETVKELYVTVDGFDGDPKAFSWRSAIDILRGVCDYCKHDNWKLCDGCMWLNGNGDEDHWTFDKRRYFMKVLGVTEDD